MLLLAGCASEMPITPMPSSSDRYAGNDTKVDKKNTLDGALKYRIHPIMVKTAFKEPDSLNRDYLQPLLSNLSNPLIYQLVNSQQLYNQYRFMRQVHSSDKKKTVFSFQNESDSSWGYVTTSIGLHGVANAFLIESEQWGSQYALIIKQMKVCLVIKASGAPRWQFERWLFPEKPGSFECVGSVRNRTFSPESGFPRLLGPYYSEKDTVFVFQKLQELEMLLSSLKSQFPQLEIPVITSQMDF